MVVPDSQQLFAGGNPLTDPNRNVPLRAVDQRSDVSSDVVLEVKQCMELNNQEKQDQKTQHIKLNYDNRSTCFTEDGIAVKLNNDKEIANSQILKKSMVVKVLGSNIMFSVCSQELRRQWGKLGIFHITTLGCNWMLCLFTTMESMDEVLSGGPWYIGNHIIGMDRWSSSFSTDSLKGISSPVWIRFPGLPLSCWDEENIPMIASIIGTPMMLDGNSFKWGKGKYAHCCVKEKLVQEQVEVLKRTDNVNEDGFKQQADDYGPWIHVKFRDRRVRNIKRAGGASSFNKQINRPVESNKQNQIVEEPVKTTETEGNQDKSLTQGEDMNAEGIQLQDIPIGVNKFQTLEGDLEEGELNEKEKTRMLEKAEPLNQYGKEVHLEVEVPIADHDLKDQLNSTSNSGKMKLANELRSLEPMEADTKKRRGTKINSKIMGDYSSIMS
ncbi:uncharacterized protein LOC110108999 [Dendrobium catenatum]|uniref:uncharacterized protein LOC110108999 n=1 Tax=Dendrobium catenatum TaxID=906689 RepID=UPI0009F44F0D|nr:uncharacterized protein LOC110108999 [Dendrobium catenatum]